MTAWRVANALLVLFTAFGTVAVSGELPPRERSIEEVVDAEIDAKLAKAGVTPAAEADDATLVRRLTLDLVGRVPTAAEARAFVTSNESHKREQLVERLMASPGFVRHQADSFDAMMMAGVRGSLRDYMTLALKEGRPWDQVFREVVLADESTPTLKGAAAFLKARVKDLDRLTNDVSTVFFGVNVSCAKCHDHPRVRDWKQDHYYGMESFFGRTYQNGTFLAERDYGVIKFKTTEGTEKKAQFQFLTGRVVDLPATEPTPEERKAEKKSLEEAKKKNVAPPPPKVSARAKLVEIALQPGERDFFARAIVNRMWHRVFGYGLVMPLDQMHSENPPSHPDLLAWLARDTIEHGYDLRRLLRGLVLSRAYGRSSRWEAGEPPEERLFAVAQVRPLTPMQLATSMWVAATDPKSLAADLGSEALDKKLESLDGPARSLASALARPGEDYQIGASEALLMSNSDRLKDLLADGDGRLVGRLSKLNDPCARIETAIRNIFTREPDDEERSLLAGYLAKRSDRDVEACRQLVWSLLNSAEFRFNH